MSGGGEVLKPEIAQAVCHFCGLPGADSQAGVGDVPGVAVHAHCWLGEVPDAAQ